KADPIGQELADKIAPGHETVVYTHTDKEHTQNHLVINSVNIENGNKYNAHVKAELYHIREASDNHCKQNELSIVHKKSAEERNIMRMEKKNFITFVKQVIIFARSMSFQSCRKNRQKNATPLLNRGY